MTAAIAAAAAAEPVAALPASRSSARLDGLDLLRGLAAGIVVLHHMGMSQPALADAERGRFATGDLATWILSTTPLHLLWEGPEAVWVFFVISGLVLVLPAQGRDLNWWRRYYPRRLARLYLPSAAAVGLSLLLWVALPRRQWTGAGWWVDAHAEAPTISSLLGDLLLTGTSWLDSPLWSLKWEVVFSALLPVGVALTVLTRRVGIPSLGAGLFLLSALGVYFDVKALELLPVFGFGALLAALPVTALPVTALGPKALWIALALLALNVTWLLTGMGWSPGIRGVRMAGILAGMLGASVLVWSASQWTPPRNGGTWPALRWLGARSFSLYLVHEPIVVSVANLFHGVPPWWSLALTLPVILAVTECFYRAVERPAINLSRSLARFLPDRTRSVLGP